MSTLNVYEEEIKNLRRTLEVLKIRAKASLNIISQLLDMNPIPEEALNDEWNKLGRIMEDVDYRSSNTILSILRQIRDIERILEEMKEYSAKEGSRY